jgi:DMSO/TMAO reductase YedYZ molybdopterin-dependent catalytic subunit
MPIELTASLAQPAATPPRDRVVEARCVLDWGLARYAARTESKAWIAHEYNGEPLSAEHGGPAQFLVPTGSSGEREMGARDRAL